MTGPGRGAPADALRGAHLVDEVIDALAHGDPAPEGAAAHAGSCLRCGGALAERRRERRALSRWSDGRDGDVSALWEGLDARLPPPPPPGLHLVAPIPAEARSRWRPALPLASAIAAVSAAAAALLLVQARPLAGLGAAGVAARVAPVSGPAAEAPAGDDEEDEVTPSAQAALARAQSEYQSAAAVLEAQVGARPRSAGNHRGAVLARARVALGALHQAGRDPHAQVRLLEGYSSYLKSLRRELDSPSELAE